MLDWNLKIVRVYWTGPCIGAHFSVTTPIFKFHYSDQDWRRCVAIGLGAMGFDILITIPLWVDNPADRGQ
jgi:hypothetical protein